jgi:hypothetical protein
VSNDDTLPRLADLIDGGQGPAGLRRGALAPSQEAGFGQPQLTQWNAALARSVEAGAEVGGIADAIVSTWREITLALGPIIGRGGVAALYRRSLYLAASVYPWLTSAYEGIETPMDLTALRLVLLQQGSAGAAAGGGALLQRFHDLVFALVGESLSEQLLGSVWALPSPVRGGETTP